MPRDRRKYLKPRLYVAVSADRARSRHIKIRFKVKLLRLMRNICDPLSLNCTRGFSSWLRINGPDLPPPSHPCARTSGLASEIIQKAADEQGDEIVARSGFGAF